MPGGERAAREPWRMAAAWLIQTFDGIDDGLFSFLESLWGDSLCRSQLNILLDPFIVKTVYPRTSSMGRLFDAVAALIYFGRVEQYEGQAAMGLEWLVNSGYLEPYPLDFLKEGGTMIIQPHQMFRRIISDLKSRRSASEISQRFHETIISGFVNVCDAARSATGMKTVALSGGCFQNSYLLTRFSKVLQERGFDVLTHSRIPGNDGGVSLGQACIANAQEV
jgi:hydrogenase maturation protein HypF